MTHPGKKFEPDPAAHKIYDRLYRKVYLRIYDRLKPLYEEFGEIPGLG
jgi:sugar (pentulose or hexulose) kinase